MTMKQLFHWLAATPRHQYTLGEALLTRDLDFATFPFSRGARLAERFVTAAGVIAAGIAFFTGAPVLGLAALSLAQTGKVAGVGAAFVVDHVQERITLGQERQADKARVDDFGKTLDEIERQGGLSKLRERLQNPGV